MRHLAIFLCLAPAFALAEPFELVDGDRVVLLGGTLIEREPSYGYWEARMTAEYPDRNVVFRNLGWSGDTVFGEARAGFGTPADGFQALREQTLALEPTVIFVAYGGNEAFEGAAGLERFQQGLETLLDALAAGGARIVLLSPPPMETLGTPLPNPAAHNRDLAVYRDQIAAASARRGLRFVDLFQSVGDLPKRGPLTDNGLHFTEEGYKVTADLLAEGLGWPKRPWPEKGQPGFAAMEQLRKAIVAKNRLFFHRWRPQNVTYLFGFRKHEQGQNAKEVAQFDPLVADAEATITNLRKSTSPED